MGRDCGYTHVEGRFSYRRRPPLNRSTLRRRPGKTKPMRRRATVVPLVVAALALTTTWALAKIIDCTTGIDIAPGSYCWVVCPQKDAAPLSALSPAGGNATITLTVHDSQGNPISDIPGQDFWLVGERNGLSLCGGAYAIDAGAPTDENGITTISGAMAAGGCDQAIYVVAMGLTIKTPEDCDVPVTLDIRTHSPDVNGDRVVDSLDANALGNAWEPLGGTYDECLDFDCNGSIDAVDFSVFGNHWQHTCL